MSLPGLLVLTDRSACTGPLVDVVAVAVECGARAVVLREKDLPDRERARLADEIAALLAPVDGLLVLAGGRGDAVHLAAAQAFPVPRPRLVGRSCHTVVEVEQARLQGCDYVTASPVFRTPSKPGYGPTLGVEGLAPMTRVALPTYALGGVRPGDVAACLGAGAHGVAVMGPVMRDPSITAGYLLALHRAASRHALRCLVTRSVAGDSMGG